MYKLFANDIVLLDEIKGLNMKLDSWSEAFKRKGLRLVT